MPIRMTGMISGLDTDAVVKELMAAHTLKKTKIEQKKTKAEWKQDKWKELNTKLYALYTEKVGKLKLQSSYMTKKVTSSNESAVTATANTASAVGSHTLKIESLASAQYVTGGTGIGDGLKDATTSTKLTDLGKKVGIDLAGTIITVKVGDKTTSMTVTDKSTISDFVTHLKNAGLNATFDAQQDRFFISSKESGKANAFSITTSSVASSSQELRDARAALEEALGDNASSLDSFYDNYRVAKEELKAKQDAYDSADADSKVSAWEELQTAKQKMQKLEDNLVSLATEAAKKEETAKATKKVAENYVNRLKEAVEAGDADADDYKAYVKVKESVDKAYYKADEDGKLVDGEFSEAALDKAKAVYRAEAEKTIKEAIKDGTVVDKDGDGNYSTTEMEADIEAEYQRLLTENGGEEAALEAKAQTLYEDAIETALTSKGTAYTVTAEGKEEVAELLEDGNQDNGDNSVITAVGEKVADAIDKYEKALTIEEVSDGTSTLAIGDTSALAYLGLGEIKTDVDGNVTISNAGVNTVSSVKAEDAKIILDGATLEGSSNTFTAAGITLDLKGTTSGSTVTLNVSNDVDAVYDSIKDFFKEYNSILKEMNTLYNASSAKGYEPLTDEEKEAMSEKQIELWEDKIKDSLLRRDTTLGNLMNAMKSAMQTSVEVDGKSYSLSSFGIMTSTDWTEGGLLHIYGDEEDPIYSSSTNKLKAALVSDPDAVIGALSGIITKLSNTMADKMKKTSLSSALTFYNDKKIKDNISDYDNQIKKWEDRLEEMENRYYNQFTAMEKAMATLQSQSSYLANLMGTGQ